MIMMVTTPVVFSFTKVTELPILSFIRKLDCMGMELNQQYTVNIKMHSFLL